MKQIISSSSVTRSTFAAAALLALFGALPGCSSDDSSGGAADCSSFTPCGGDLSGTWHVGEACVSDSAKADLADAFKVCDAATVTLSPITYSGTVSYSSGTEQADVTIAVKANETIPASCLNGASCATIQGAFAGQTANGVKNATCQASAGGCSCAFDLALPATSQYSYTTSGTTLTETRADDGSMESSEYCVAGSVLKVKTSEGVIALSR